MADALTKPAEFDAANRWLAARVNVPTTLSSAQLAMLPELAAGARTHAFFSARVSTAGILEALRAEVDAYGATGYDLAAARVRIKTFLASQGVPVGDVGWADTPPAGVSIEDWKAAKQITNIGSTRRLDLILKQNARMAWAAGRKEVSEQPAVLDRWPYYRYIARRDGRERPEHGALHDLVLPKGDPFWATHTPPWDYNCRCDIEDADGEDAAAAGGPATAIVRDQADGAQSATVAGPQGIVNITPNESGYTWDAASALRDPAAGFDWDTIKNAALREAARADIEGYQA
jgi:SPP1 gp7 family putative phage head morphogenesis protein